VSSFEWNWKDGERDPRAEAVLYYLLHNPEGVTTSKIAEMLNYQNPTSTGRVIVRRILLRICKVSKRVKSAPIIIRVGKHWKLNYDEFDFSKISSVPIVTSEPFIAENPEYVKTNNSQAQTKSSEELKIG
jgi:hypothetical protein